MNNEQADRVMSMLSASWPGHRWTDEAVDLWLRDLVSIEGEVGLLAVQDCRERLDFAPSWHQYLEGVRNVRRERARSAERQTAIGAGPRATAEGTEMAIAVLRELRARQASLDSHNHKPRFVAVVDASGDSLRDENGRIVRRLVEGMEACPVCSRHDHKDKATFGFTVTRSTHVTKDGPKIAEHQEAVPAWWFTCPRCGDNDKAQEFCSTWTPKGIEFMRSMRQTVKVGTVVTGDF